MQKQTWVYMCEMVCEGVIQENLDKAQEELKAFEEDKK